jgi:iron complex transport system substrate-binding protein
MLTLLCLFTLFPVPGLIAENIEVTDADLKVVSVPKEPQRIICLSFVSYELIRLMGAAERVAGTIDFVKVSELMAPENEIPVSVGNGFTPDMEALARLSPDLVVAYTFKPGPDLTNRLNSLGIPLLRLDFYPPSVLARETLVMAEVLGGEAPGRAEAYLSWLKDHREKIAAIVAKVPKKPTIIMEHFLENRIFGPGAASYEVAEMTGAINLGSVMKRTSNTVDTEWVIKQNPDVFIKVLSLPDITDPSKKREIMEKTRKEILNRKGWEDMDAIKNGKVYVWDSDISNGARYIVGLYQLCHWLYPDLVPENASEEVNLEYWNKFQGKDFK